MIRSILAAIVLSAVAISFLSYLPTNRSQATQKR